MINIESKLLASENKIKTLFNSIPIPTYAWQKIDNDFILIDYNNAAKEATKGKIKSFLNIKVSSLLENRPELVEEFNRCLHQKTGASREFKYKMKSTGEELYLSIKYFYVPPDLVILHTKDITNRKLIEENLKNSEAKFRHLFEQAPYSIVLTSMDGIILDFNLATKRLLGYSKEDLIGKNYLELDIYPSKFLPTLKSRFQILIEGKPIEPIELQIKKRDGSIAWILSQLSLLELGDKTLLYTIIIDITDRKNFEKTIKRKLEIEKVISSISSKFVSNVNIDKTISYSLIKLGRLIGAHRAYILLYNEECKLEFFTQEWCADDVESNNIEPMIIRIDKYPWCFNQFKEKGFIHIQDVSILPQEAKATKEELEHLKIKSLLALQVKIRGDLYGFIGFDNIKQMKKWSKEDFSLLRISSELIANALERKWAEETLRGSNQLLVGIISSLTESICVIDNNFNIIWVNNVVKSLFGSKVIQKKCYEAFFQRTKPCTKCIANKTFSDGKIHEKEYKFRDINRKEKEFWCTSSAAALNFDGQTELAVLIFREMHKR